MADSIAQLEARLAALPAGDGDPRARAAALNDLAGALTALDPRRALELCLEAHEHSSALDHAQGVARSLLIEADSRCHLSDFATALERALAALSLCARAADAAGQAGALHRIGEIHYWLGDYPGALDHQHKSLQLSRARGDAAGEAAALTAIGSVQRRLGDHSKAIDCHLQALKLRAAAADGAGQAVTLRHLGSVYRDMGAGGKALDYYQRSLALQAEGGDGRGQAVTLCRLGAVHAQLGAYPAAQECFARGLELARAHGDKLTEVELLIALGRLSLELDEPGGARDAAGRALALAETIRYKAGRVDSHLLHSEVDEAAGDPAAALRHHREFHRLQAEVYGEAAGQRARTQQVQLEVDRTLQENVIFRVKNVELAEASEKQRRLITALGEVNEQNKALIEQLRQQGELLEQQANVDALTGLYNRRYLESQLAQEFRRARRFKRELSVAMADIDQFKQINDGYSHLVGDEVLRAVAQILRASCRSINIIARYGGEEFVIIFPETPAEKAAIVGERIRQSVEQHPWALIHPALAVTLSLGISDDLDVPDHEKLLSLADAKMYEAKNAGKNRVCF